MFPILLLIRLMSTWSASYPVAQHFEVMIDATDAQPWPQQRATTTFKYPYIHTLVDDDGF